VPCYNPPPPWEGKQKENAEQAVRLLCSMVGQNLATMPNEVLTWFLEHREIDLEIATGSCSPDVSGAEAAKNDIARVRAILGV
jgi:hypothetical protein